MFKLKSTFIRYSYRHLSTKSYYLANLKSKNLLTITGKDSIDFLQGLITNDVRYKSNDNHSNSTSCIYSFILNNTGRIIADLFVHRLITKQNDDNDNDAILLLEVDQQISSILIKLLKRYKIKSKVSIKQSDTDDWHCYSLFPTIIENNTNEIIEINNNESNTIFVNDPRNNYFGYKILTKIQSNNELLSFLNEMNPKWKIIDIDENRYRSFRYQYGIGEGSLDFPIETSLPFDANGDILNGISFQKGCYIGQELTARTYHTGVIRKRIMPIKIIDPLVESNEMLPLQNVIDSDGKNVGRFRSNYGDQGLAVLKFDSISSDSRLKLSKTGHRIRTWRPFWWPESIIEQQMKLESS